MRIRVINADIEKHNLMSTPNNENRDPILRIHLRIVIIIYHTLNMIYIF